MFIKGPRVDLSYTFIILQPFVNNLNGALMKFAGISLIGPTFYTLAFLHYLISYLTQKNTPTKVLITFTSAIWILSIFFLGSTTVSDIPNLMKFTLPILLFSHFKSRVSSVSIIQKYQNAIHSSIAIYCAFVALSFIIRFRYETDSSRGFQGFLQAQNDFILLLIIYFAYVSAGKISPRKKIMVLVTLYFVKTKAYIPLIGSYIISFKKRSIVFIAIVTVIASYAFSSQLIKLINLQIRTMSYGHITNYAQINIHNPFTWRIATAGRTDFVQKFMNSTPKWSAADFLFGIGPQREAEFLDGKIGMEMDPFDTYAAYGIIGIAILLAFYYIPFFATSVNKESKMIFGIVVLYSIIGGHFFNNPVCGSYYGIILGILYNESAQARSQETTKYDISNTHSINP